MNKRWRVYIVRCADNSLYTGITVDLNKRLDAHNSGRGAKYTRSRRPVVFVYTGSMTTQGNALREEKRIKSLTRTQKLMIIKEYSEEE